MESPTEPARDLDQALAGMSFELLPGRFALVGLDSAPRAQDLALFAGGPGQLVVEGGETTWLIARDAAEELSRAHPGARLEGPLVWIRFVAPMDWQVVGFLAKVTGSLAAAGVPLGAVCGFSRDHLFVDEHYLEPTLETLRALFPERSS